MLFYFGLLLKKEMTAFMPIEDKVTTSLTILITGFVVVFAVLLLLILLISLYGKIVSSALNSKAEKKTVVNVETPKTEVIPANVPTTNDSEVLDENGLNDEIIAVITSAVYMMYGEKKVKIKSVKKVPQARSAWGTAGIMENTRPF